MNTPDERKDLYQKYREDILKRQLSNTENLDRAILTLSTSILGLTLTFIGNVTPVQKATHVRLLYLAWFLLVIAIVITLISFFLSQAGLNLQLEYAEQYYLQQNDEYLTEKNNYAILTQCVSYVSVGAFIIALIALVFFVLLNIK
jgi:hypothetical protein